MKILVVVLIAIAMAAVSSCGGSVAPVPPPNTDSSKSVTQPTALPQPANGNYPGKGKVTKLNMDAGSIELDHDEIKGVMPKMVMEFYVSDRSMLKNLAVGDTVDFTLQLKDNRESIVRIEKSK